MTEKTIVQNTNKDHVIVATEAQDIQVMRAIIKAYGSPSTIRFIEMTGDEKSANSMIKGHGVLHLKSIPLVHAGVLDLAQPMVVAAAVKPLIDAEIAKLPASTKSMAHVVGLRREIEVNTTRATTTIHCAFAFDG